MRSQVYLLPRFIFHLASKASVVDVSVTVSLLDLFIYLFGALKNIGVNAFNNTRVAGISVPKSTVWTNVGSYFWG